MAFKQSFQMNQDQLKNFGAALRSARKAKGLGLKEVGEYTGTSPQAVGQWERGENGPSMAKLIALGRLFEIDVDAAMQGEVRPATPSKTIHPSGPETTEVEKISEGWPDVGDEWMDVRGVTVGGADAGFYFGDVIDQVRRPPGIRNAKNVAALNTTGDSMVPRFRPGELIYVQLREPAPGDDVVVELYPENDGDAPKAFLKELTKTTGRKLFCRQHNPKREIEFDRGEVNRLWRVLTLRDLLG